MVKKRTFLITVILIITAFVVGTYFQDLKHQESTAVYWKANRHNMERFNNIQKIMDQMNSKNWGTSRKKMYQELDTLVILRFRKEVDSINKIKKTP